VAARKKASNGALFFSVTNNFLEVFLPKQRGYSECTVKAYRETLRLFRKWLFAERGESVNRFRFDQCDRDCVMAFLDHLASKGCSRNTRNQRLSALKTYVGYAADNDISLQTFAIAIHNIKGVKAHTPVRESLSEEEMVEIIRQPEDSLIGLRDRTILVTLYDSACRLAEVLSLTMGNVCTKANEPYIRVLGKGDKERIISLNPATAELIEKYDKQFRKSGKAGTDLLFYTVIKEIPDKMSERNVELMLAKYSARARETCPSIPEKVYPHMLRRTRATHLYHDGISLPLISRLLGHAHLETTKIYASPSMGMMRDAMSAASAEQVKNEKPLWTKSKSEAEVKSEAEAKAKAEADAEDEAAAKLGLR
jgi:site-specific recombinase XerD